MKSQGIVASDFADRVCIAIAASVALHVTFRAATLAITHDEALTYLWHVSGSWQEILLFATPGLPDNNHLFYTLLAKASTGTFGLGELPLRLPSLLGCGLYLYGAYGSTRRISSGAPRIVGMLMLCTNPYIVDFLGLARGYGLGLGLMMTGVAIMLSAARGPEATSPATSAAAVGCFSLAALANLTFLLPLIAAMVILSTRVLRERLERGGTRPSSSAKLLRTLAALALPALPVLALLAIPIGRLKREHLFTIGGTESFWSDTVGGLVRASLYELAQESRWVLVVTVWTAIALLPVTLCVARRAAPGKRNGLDVVYYLLVLTALGSVLQHATFGVALLTERRGLFFLPLFFLTLAGAVHHSALPKRFHTIVTMLVLLPQLALLATFIFSANHTHTRDWRHEAATREVMAAIARWSAHAEQTAPIQLEVSWVLQPGVMFYRELFRIQSRLRPPSRDAIRADGDVYYVLDWETPKVPMDSRLVAAISALANSRVLTSRRFSEGIRRSIDEAGTPVDARLLQVGR